MPEEMIEEETITVETTVTPKLYAYLTVNGTLSNNYYQVANWESVTKAETDLLEIYTIDGQYIYVSKENVIFIESAETQLVSSSFETLAKILETFKGLGFLLKDAKISYNGYSLTISDESYEAESWPDWFSKVVCTRIISKFTTATDGTTTKDYVELIISGTRKKVALTIANNVANTQVILNDEVITGTSTVYCLGSNIYFAPTSGHTWTAEPTSCIVTYGATTLTLNLAPVSESSTTYYTALPRDIGTETAMKVNFNTGETKAS